MLYLIVAKRLEVIEENIVEEASLAWLIGRMIELVMEMRPDERIFLGKMLNLDFSPDSISY